MLFWITVTPAWWASILSGFVWIWLIGHASPDVSKEPILCVTPYAYMVNPQGFLETVMAFNQALIPWVLMVVAMMFPMLSEQIRHVAFSVQRATKDTAILFFLIGYTMVWMAVGAAFSISQFYLAPLVEDSPYLSRSILTAIGFFLAAALVWLPSRGVALAACRRALPIRIYGWRPYVDSLRYGVDMGLVCVRICWAPMLAMTLANHNLFIMALITTCILYERYRLPHKSKMIGYAWAVTGLVSLAIGLLEYELI